MTPSEFAAQFAPVASLNQYWAGVSNPRITVNSIFKTDNPPGEDNYISGASKTNESSWSSAIKNALKAVQAAVPFSGKSPLADAVGLETQRMGEASAEVVSAAANSVRNVGSSVASGAKWVTIVLLLLLAGYVFLLVAPFLPKPRSA